MSPERSVKDLFGPYKRKLAERVGFESTSYKETRKFCGAAWPSKVLKGKRGNSYCPLNAPEDF
jgi:hypothetical protein